jgi:hypothetical protein
MIAIIGHWEDNEANPFSGRIADVGRWINQLIAFGVNTLVMVDDTMAKVPESRLQELVVSSPEPLAKEFNLKRASTLEDAVKLFPTYTKVYVERAVLLPEGVKYTPIFDFVHPKDTVYVFGRDYIPVEGERSSLDVAERVAGQVVTIDYPNSDKVSLYAQEALSIVLYDRLMKERK